MPVPVPVPVESPAADHTTVSRIIRSRRSIRHYRPEPVPAPLLRELVDLALEAPSSFNLQARSVVTVAGEEGREVAVPKAHHRADLIGVAQRIVRRDGAARRPEEVELYAIQSQDPAAARGAPGYPFRLDLRQQIRVHPLPYRDAGLDDAAHRDPAQNGCRASDVIRVGMGEEERFEPMSAMGAEER